eukprot:154858-Chlamydomonas_euryale.AAC.2
MHNAEPSSPCGMLTSLQLHDAATTASSHLHAPTGMQALTACVQPVCVQQDKRAPVMHGGRSAEYGSPQCVSKERPGGGRN